MKKLSLLILLLIVLLGFPHGAQANSTVTPPPGWVNPGSYTEVSPDNKYLLVMLKITYYAGPHQDSPEIRAQNKLLQTYPTSGLYLNDGSNKPLWSLPYIEWPSRVTFTSDGHHLIFRGTRPLFGFPEGQIALVFYEDGRLLASYNLSDLVTNIVPKSIPTEKEFASSGINDQSEWISHYSVDEKSGLLNLETYTDEKYLFSLHTGQIVSAVRPTALSLQQRSESSDVEVPVAPQSTVLADTRPTSARVPQDYTFSIVLLISAGSLTTVFAGANVIGAKARRKRANSPYLATNVAAPDTESKKNVPHTRVRVIPVGSAGTARRKQRAGNE